MNEKLCFCPCHTRPGAYPTSRGRPCSVCGHVDSDGQQIGDYRSGWTLADNRLFPIQGGDGHRDETGAMRYTLASTVPWWLAEEAYKNYRGSQALERIAQRGGFGREELLMLLRNQDT